MSLPIKSVSLSGISPRSFIITIIGIALVVALFFLPEIAELHKSLLGFPSSPSTGTEAVQENVVKEEVAQSSGISTMDRIVGLLDSSYVDRLGIGKKNSPAQQGVTSSAVEFSWAAIKSKPSAHALRGTSKECQNIIKQLSSDKPATRFAIQNFINGINLLLGSGDKNMTAIEAVAYLANLQNTVVRVMMRENVDIGTYNNFVALDLGPVVDLNQKRRLASQLKPFNPRLTLTAISVKKVGSKLNIYQESAPPYVQVKGYVIGNDVKSIQLFYNGNLLKVFKPGRPNELNQRNFSTRRYYAKGIYTFRVFDSLGQMWEKSYVFYPRVKVYPWKGGAYAIPKTSEMDTRLDRFFTFRPGHLAAPSTAFLDEYNDSEYTRF